MRREMKVWAGVVAALVAVGSAGFANITNTVPYEESFESYAVGTEITGMGGWYGISNAGTVASEDLSGFTHGFPIDGATHTNVLELAEPITNLFERYDPSDPDESVYIDLLVEPVPRDNPPGNLDTNVQTALYMDSGGQINVYHAMFGETPPQMWTQLQHPPLSTGDWIRVTLDMKYTKDEFGGKIYKYFRVGINGGPWIESIYGYPQIPPAGGGDTNGPWFLQAGSETGGGNPYLTSISTEGPGAIDDVVVTTNAPTQSKTTSMGVPIDWYTNNGLDPNNPTKDTDGDGSPDWAEWVAGTDANNPSNFLEVVIAEGSMGGLSWSGTTNTGGSATYSIYRRADLLTGDWGTPVVNGIPKGTTTWTDPMPPADGANYKLGIPWTYPDGQ